MRKNCKGIIFDFNGTLFNDTQFHNEAWSEFATLHNFQLLPEDYDKSIHGFTNREIIKYIFKSELTGKQLDSYSEEKEEIYRRICAKYPEKIILTKGAETFLDHLAALKVPRTIATASYLKNVRFYFEIFQLDRWFDIGKVIYDSGEFRGKPHPDMFLAAASKLNLHPGDCMIIEDSKGGIRAAKNAGAGTIVAADFGKDPGKFTEFTFIDRIITDFNDLLPWFE